MDPQIIQQLLTGAGPIGLLAYAMFMAYRKDQQADKERIVELLQQERGRNDTLIQVVKDNTEAMTALKAAVESMRKAA